MVNAAGLAGLAATQVSIGFELAAGHAADEWHPDGRHRPERTLLRTVPCPVPPQERHRLRGARRAAASSPPPAGPVTVQRRVSRRGQIMAATQRIQVGMIHAGKIVTVTAEDHASRFDIDGETINAVPRAITREIHRYKARATRSPQAASLQR